MSRERQLLCELLAWHKDKNEDTTNFNYIMECVEECLSEPETEPVSCIYKLQNVVGCNINPIFFEEFKNGSLKEIPLYTSPQQNPLSIDDIEDIWDELEISTFDNVIELTRAIEKAHGIT